MTTGHGHPPPSPLSLSRPVLFKAHLCPPPLQQLQTSPLPPSLPPARSIGLDRGTGASQYVQYTPTLASSAKGVVGVGTLLAAFPDPPHRRYQDCRPTDQCRERRRRRLGVHRRRLLGRTAGHRRPLENRLTALRSQIAPKEPLCALALARARRARLTKPGIVGAD